MCNLVTLDTGSNYRCNSEGGLLPGYISGLSKAPCKLWKSLSLSEDKDIRVRPNLPKAKNSRIYLPKILDLVTRFPKSPKNENQ